MALTKWAHPVAESDQDHSSLGEGSRMVRQRDEFRAEHETAAVDPQGDGHESLSSVFLTKNRHNYRHKFTMPEIPLIF